MISCVETVLSFPGRYPMLKETLSRLINERLWDKTEQMYYDFEIKTQKLHRFPSICSFMPLFAGKGACRSALTNTQKE